MSKLMFQSTQSRGSHAPSARHGVSFRDVLVGLAVIFATICFALAAKRDMVSAEAPHAPAPIVVTILR